MEKSDVSREADEMIRLFGIKAALIAEMRASRAVPKGDTGKFHFWNRVADAIKDVERRNKAPAAPDGLRRE
jgi:hypothetical protein